MDMMKTLTELVGAFGPSGCEKEISQVIEGLAAPYVDEISRDTMGNLICHKKGSGPRVMFSAHMDSIGLVATHIDDKGVVHVGALGGVSPKEVLYTPVRFQNGVRGLVCAPEDADMAKLKVSDILVDIGAADEAEAKKLVQVGDAAVYDTATRAAAGRIISPYLDDRIACLVLLMAMERLEETDNDLYFVFSVQEEVGCRGAKTAAWAIDPDYGIAVDVTGADDEPGSKHMASSLCGKGAAVKVMDRSVICTPALVEKLMELGAEKGIPVQRDVLQFGGTDAGPIQATRAGVYAGGISIPCRYTHTPTEMVDQGDVNACVELVAAFAASKLKD
ncbi:MAG: M42 family metallopeptidase [Oscillospiraceae bacterium]|nr:M42 family metallopeptidase [Oscillospiraceae bacterium]